MVLANTNRKEISTTLAISSALEKLRIGGKSATRRALSELKQLYNTFNRPDARFEKYDSRFHLFNNVMMVRNPEFVREEIYRKYYTYFRQGL